MTDERLSPYLRQLPVGVIAPQAAEALKRHTRLVLTAPPGAGKSTLLPLVLLQSVGNRRILMLEPRRIAARQVAERMAAMLGEPVGQTVGYRMRFETRTSAHTRIEVITEGILPRLLAQDPFLEDVAVLIFDEFHERSLTTDMAFAMARATQAWVRPDLQLLVLSATLDTQSLCRAFDAPHLQCEGRMYDVAVVHGQETDAAHCAIDVARTIVRAMREHEGSILAFLPGQAEIRTCEELLSGQLGDTLLCPLYGLMSGEDQRQAILPAPAGRRKVVLATPLAETSITIEGVGVVVDSGLCRRPVFDPRSGLSRLQTVRISLDMARQRSGRAGRTANGYCYRLWTKATEDRMDETRRPEIEEADLASLVLDVAAWGEPDLERLPWLTPPPKVHLIQARSLLRLLGALDDDGRITPHGHRLAALPCHPRMAQLLLCATDGQQRALATDLAALLEEKDPMPSSEGVDICLRLVRLRQARSRKPEGAWARIERIAALYRKMVQADADNTPPDATLIGRLVAAAYPERIAALAGHNTYKLASGDMVGIDDADDLAAAPLLAVAACGNRIFLAAPVERDDVIRQAAWRDNLSWDSTQGKVVARSECRLGALVLATRPTADVAREQIVHIVVEAAKKEGIRMFNFDEHVRRLQLRVAAVSAWHPELNLPDVDTEALLCKADTWLPLYIGKADSTVELKKIDLCQVVEGLLSYEQQQAVQRLAPTHLVMPSGSRIAVDYRPGADAPVVSVRLQECFGLTDTPRVDDGRKPVLMELLSPGFKPVQLTQDLRSFWQDTYFEVRKELRRRYPKHEWPDNPLEAEAVRGVKRRQPNFHP